MPLCFFVLTYAASIFDLEIFIRSFLHLCITPVLKLILNISAKLLADRVKKGQLFFEQVCHITIICWTYLPDLSSEWFLFKVLLERYQEKRKHTKVSFWISQIHREMKMVKRKSRYANKYLKGSLIRCTLILSFTHDCNSSF